MVLAFWQSNKDDDYVFGFRVVDKTDPTERASYPLTAEGAERENRRISRRAIQPHRPVRLVAPRLYNQPSGILL